MKIFDSCNKCNQVLGVYCLISLWSQYLQEQPKMKDFELIKESFKQFWLKTKKMKQTNDVSSCMAFAKYKHASEIIPRKRQTRLAFDVKALHSLGNRCVIQLQVNKSYNVSISLENKGHSITTWRGVGRDCIQYQRSLDKRNLQIGYSILSCFGQSGVEVSVQNQRWVT